jgi:hypothetical protein
LKGFADVWSIFISAFYFKQFEGEDGDRHEELIYKDESVCSSKKRPETIGNIVALFLHSAINHRELLFCFFPILRTKKLES